MYVDPKIQENRRALQVLNGFLSRCNIKAQRAIRIINATHKAITELCSFYDRCKHPTHYHRKTDLIFILTYSRFTLPEQANLDRLFEMFPGKNIPNYMKLRAKLGKK